MFVTLRASLLQLSLSAGAQAWRAQREDDDVTLLSPAGLHHYSPLLPWAPGEVPPPLPCSPQTSPPRGASRGPHPWTSRGGTQTAKTMSHWVRLCRVEGESSYSFCVMDRLWRQECHTVYDKECITETNHKYKTEQVEECQDLVRKKCHPTTR